MSAHVGPNIRGVFLGLVEVYQRQERWQNAIACLERLRRLEPDDVVVKLSLSELLLKAYPGDKRICRKIVKLSEGIENEMPAHAALMLYKARALRQLGLPIAARDALSAALRRKMARPTSFSGRSDMNEPWSTRTSASAGGHAANSRSFMPKTRTMRTWQHGWDCDKL